ncbi:MAG: hypothetical protein M3081_03545 [Gemmatimonadota bacterium]|nr:hypothetical protein [Gemmatimonadota bacterium]
MFLQHSRIVLIVAVDPVVAALLGLLGEFAGEAPQFPAPGEVPADAIRRVRAAVVFLDCHHDVACEDHAYAAADEVGSEVLLFAHERERHHLERMAAARNAHALRLPIHPHQLASRVSEVLAA